MEERDTGNKWPNEQKKYKEILEWFSQGDDYLAVVLKESNQVFGLIAKEKQEEGSFGFGYVFHSDYFNKGYATEAGIAVIDFIFNKLEGQKIVTGTPEENESSNKLLRGLGFNNQGRGEHKLAKEAWKL